MSGTFTITWLAMQTRPTTPRRALPSPDITLIRAHNPPVRFFRYLYDAVGSDYDWTDLHAWSDKQIAKFAQDPAVHLHVAYKAGSPAGFIQLDFRRHPTADISYFGLVPEAIGSGIGPWLLLQGIHMAWDTGIEKLTVNTCTLDHPRALPLYRRMGFEPIRSEQRAR